MTSADARRSCSSARCDRERNVRATVRLARSTRRVGARAVVVVVVIVVVIVDEQQVECCEIARRCRAREDIVVGGDGSSD